MPPLALHIVLVDGETVRGVKFSPPKHWVIQGGLVIHSIFNEQNILAPGDRLLAIDDVSVDGMQFGDVVDILREATSSTVLRFETTRLMDHPLIFRQKPTTSTHRIDGDSWTVHLSNGLSLKYDAFILNLLRDRYMGLCAGDVLVAINGSVVLGASLNKIQALMESSLPNLVLEWIDYKPRLSSKNVNAWMALNKLHFKPRQGYSQCHLCSATFGLFKHKNNCSICGHVVCSTCRAKCHSVVSTVRAPIKYQACLQCAHEASHVNS